jgi:hypothetical protein
MGIILVSVKVTNCLSSIACFAGKGRSLKALISRLESVAPSARICWRSVMMTLEQMRKKE